ncbi:FkbM family methyltransferase [Halochromatium glycolicum]|nr:FkbM family methyltransferase [Halochromatium glycolicum]
MHAEEPLWPQALARYPFAARLLPGWREQAADLPADYQAALDDALTAFDLERPLGERYQRLLASQAHLLRLTAAPDAAHDEASKPEDASNTSAPVAPIAPTLLRIRLHLALGEPALARQWIDRLLHQLDGDAATKAAVDTLLRGWPCLPISAAFDTCAPGQTEGDVAMVNGTKASETSTKAVTSGEPSRIDADAWRDWLLAQLLDTQAQLTRAQRHAEPETALPLLVKRRRLPCAGIESERRLALTALRLGKKVTIKPESRLVTKGQNPQLWIQLGERANSEPPRSGANQPAAKAEPIPARQPAPAKPNQRNAKPAAAQPTPAAASKHSPTRKQRTPARLWQLKEPIRVVDIGANPIDGTPPYASLLKQGVIRLVGFEPQADALAKLQQMKGPHETYLPHAVGDGGQATLYICQASGMTSTLKPNNAVLDHFQGYPIWGKIKSTAVLDTVRLDDVTEITHIDWLKIDIQGGELTVFKHGERKLKDALVIQTEANFIHLYEGQPLFADIDQWMRAHGFMLHTLLEQRRRLYAPMTINGGIHQGLNQLTTADAVYIPSFDRLNQLTTSDLLKLATIMDEAYHSYDYTLQLLGLIDSGGSRSQKAYAQRYQERLKHIKLTADSPPPFSPAPTSSADAGMLLLRHPRSYLNGLDWEQSLRSGESTVKGKPVPWVTYPFLHLLDKRIRSNFKVFEYGSGNSTLWLSSHVEKIVSVEHDAGWYQKMKGKMPGNVEYIYHTLDYGGAYGKEITKPQYKGVFDIVFVDGRDRVNCLRNCVHALKQDGIVILDNAERPQYNSGSESLLQQGFKRIDFIGMGPVNLAAWSTAVFYRARNCIGL